MRNFSSMILIGLFLVTFPTFAATKRSGFCKENKALRAQVETSSVKLLGPTSDSSIRWESYEKAIENSKKDLKPICLFFTGSDWCIWCKKIDQQILRTHDFTQYAAGNLHMVEVDFPSCSSQKESLVKLNRELKNKYEVRGFPELVFINADGEVLGRSGFESGGPASYVAKIKQMLAQ